MEAGFSINVANFISISYDNHIKFEYDGQKSRSNQEKHGISFEEAKVLWKSPHVMVVTKWPIEQRFMLVGKVGDKFYSCFFTISSSDVVRLISVRRSRKSEKEKYYEKYED